MFILFEMTIMSSLAMEVFDIIDVPEYGVFLAGDLRWGVKAVHMLQVMDGEKVDIFHKLRLTIY